MHFNGVVPGMDDYDTGDVVNTGVECDRPVRRALAIKVHHVRGSVLGACYVLQLVAVLPVELGASGATRSRDEQHQSAARFPKL